MKNFSLSALTQRQRKHLYLFILFLFVLGALFFSRMSSSSPLKGSVGAPVAPYSLPTTVNSSLPISQSSKFSLPTATNNNRNTLISSSLFSLPTAATGNQNIHLSSSEFSLPHATSTVSGGGATFSLNTVR